ncbi:MAG: thymidylate kinase [Candidatus Uhrbacteria bacterium]
MQTKNNLFIVIDGSDSTGKGTQTKLLLDRFIAEGVDHQSISFPQYKNKSAGPTEEYLSGKYGQAHEVGPHASSIFYAVDRFDASFQIRDWLNQGKTVITDRYVTANMGHQGGKISDRNEREEFFKWNEHLEHEIFGIPRPDICIILHVPTETALKLQEQRGGWKSDLKNDIHETDAQHLRDAETSYLHIADIYPNSFLISCDRDGQLRSKEDIHNEIWQIVTTYTK